MEPIMNASEALDKVCNTMERTWGGNIYTLSDIRFPELMGKKIVVTLEYGKNIAKWVEREGS